MKAQLEKINKIQEQIDSCNFQIGCRRYGIVQMMNAKHIGLEESLDELETTEEDEEYIERYEVQKFELQEKMRDETYKLYLDLKKATKKVERFTDNCYSEQSS